ncbi:MAG TPA: hypothetical protein VGK87_14635 [Anaerolineae bacterium]
MKIRGVLIVVCAVLLAACGAGSPSTSGSTSATSSSNNDGWTNFSSDKGQFTVRMPSEPKQSTQSVDTAAGKIDVALFTAVAGNTAYVASYSDYPEAVMAGADPLKVLEGAMNGAVTNIGGTLIDSKDVSLNDVPGKEFSANGKIANQGEGSMRGRLYLVKNRLYQLIVVGLKDQLPTADVDKYLQSFKLTK